VQISVVVPTYKRPESLRRCLDALVHQQTPAAEILVVVRAEDLAGQAVVRSYEQPVRLVLVERPGVIAAMNAGGYVSTGDVVALTDDDAAPHPDWLERIGATYETDTRIGAVGGRDWIYKQGVLQDGTASAVGTINLFGRVTGNHHLGVGPPRDVDILKGVNLSVRGELLRRVRFDERLIGVGTEHHWELSLCLTLRRLGLRVVYDPRIAVDHHPQPRVDDSRRFSSRELRDATHNETLALLEYLPAWRRALFLAWAFAIGTGTAPGLAQLARALTHRRLNWTRFLGAQSGMLLGLRSYLRSRRVR
jgi:glycosyltransferase involved in cell wall biosynthesis